MFIFCDSNDETMIFQNKYMGMQKSKSYNEISIQTNIWYAKTIDYKSKKLNFENKDGIIYRKMALNGYNYHLIWYNLFLDYSWKSW